MSTPVLTIVDGRVPESKRAEFEAGVRRLFAPGVETTMIQSLSLVARDSKDRDRHFAMSFWERREDLEAYRASVPVPASLKLFRDIGVEPTVRVVEVLVRAERASGR